MKQKFIIPLLLIAVIFIVPLSFVTAFPPGSGGLSSSFINVTSATMLPAQRHIVHPYGQYQSGASIMFGLANGAMTCSGAGSPNYNQPNYLGVTAYYWKNGNNGYITYAPACQTAGYNTVMLSTTQWQHNSAWTIIPQQYNNHTASRQFWVIAMSDATQKITIYNSTSLQCTVADNCVQTYNSKAGITYTDNYGTIADVGMNAEEDSSGNVFVTYTQTRGDGYYAAVVKFTSPATGSASAAQYGAFRVAVPSDNDIPMEAMALLNHDTPYVFTWGIYGRLSGNLWRASDGYNLVTFTGSTTSASMVDTTNGLIDMAFIQSDGIHEAYINNAGQWGTTNPSGLLTAMFTGIFTDVAEFRLPNGQFGIMFTNSQVISYAYYGYNGIAHQYRWAGPFALWTTPVQGNAKYISADVDGTINKCISPATCSDGYFKDYLPAVEVYDSINQKLYMIQVALPYRVSNPVQPGILTTTTQTTLTIYPSQQTGYIMVLIMMFVFVMIPMFLLGIFFGTFGLVIGMVTGSWGGYFYGGSLPIVVPLIFTFISVGVAFAYREDVLTIQPRIPWRKHKEEEF